MDGFLHIGKTKLYHCVKHSEDTEYLYGTEFQRDVYVKFDTHMYLFIGLLDLINCSTQFLLTIIP